MTRSDGVALGLAATGHLALLALLSFVWTGAPPPSPKTQAIAVSLADDIALDQTAPAAAVPPSQSTAPESGRPDDAPPPATSAQGKPEPAAPKLAADAVPPPKPVPPKPVPPAPTVVKPSATRGRPTGSLLDDDFRKGLTQSAARDKASDAAPGVTMDAKAAADIASAIKRQVQPCAERQSVSGPGASRIIVTIRLQLNPNGSLAARPVISDHAGVDDENRIYVDAVDRAAIASFVACSPLRGLPAELYDVPRGWKSFILRFKLP